MSRIDAPLSTSTPYAASRIPSQPASPSGEPGFMVAADHLKDFATALDSAGTRYDGVVSSVPQFGGWDYVPGVGFPEPLGWIFAERFNSVADTVGTALKELGRVTADAGTKLTATANLYIQTEQKVTSNVNSIGHTP